MAAAVAAAGAGEPLSPEELLPKAEAEKAEEELEEDDDDEVLGPAGSGAGAGGWGVDAASREGGFSARQGRARPRARRLRCCCRFTDDPRLLHHS